MNARGHETVKDIPAQVRALNEIIASTGEPLEGNLFYEHHDPHFVTGPLTERFDGKRRNLVTACEGRRRMLEIGLNGGHSALMLLSCHPKLEMHSVDIGRHRYTALAAQFLQEQFPGRFFYHEGDSVHVLPQLRMQRRKCFDVIHIDGLHTLAHCRTDFLNTLPLARPGAWIMIDDTDMPHIQAFYEECLRNGWLVKGAPKDWQEVRQHAIGKVPRRLIG